MLLFGFVVIVCVYIISVYLHIAGQSLGDEDDRRDRKSSGLVCSFFSLLSLFPSVCIVNAITFTCRLEQECVSIVFVSVCVYMSVRICSYLVIRNGWMSSFSFWRFFANCLSSIISMASWSLCQHSWRVPSIVSSSRGRWELSSCSCSCSCLTFLSHAILNFFVIM